MAFPINPPNAALVDGKGLVTRPWYLFFLNIQKLIGTSATNPFDDSTLLGIGDMGGGLSQADLTALIMNTTVENPPPYYLLSPIEPGTLTPGAGLTGGGNMGANVTVTVGAGTGITVNADDVALTVQTAHGTYTPTLTNVANLDASTAYSCQYLRVGNTVTVSGRVDIDPTLAATSTQLGIELPIASNFANANECAGTAFASGIAGQGAAILADTANDRAQLQYISGDITNQALYFTFSYRVI